MKHILLAIAALWALAGPAIASVPWIPPPAPFVQPAVVNVNGLTDVAVRAAFTTAAANPGRAYIINMPNGPVTLASALPVLSNVTVNCVTPLIQGATQSIYDSLSFVGGAGNGTVLSGDGTFAAFTGNNTPLGSPGAFTNWIVNFNVHNCGFSNFTRAFDIGATNNPGLANSHILNNVIIGMTDVGYNFENMVGLWLSGNVIRNGGPNGCGILEGDIPTDFYSAGNVYAWNDFCNNLRGWRSIATVGSVFGGIISSGLQDNKGFVPYSLSVTPSNGSPNWPVSDLTKWGVGMWMHPTSTADGLTINRHYVVTSVSGASGSGTVQLANYAEATPISSTGTTALTFALDGFPGLSLEGGGLHPGDTYTGLDLEGSGTVIALDQTYNTYLNFGGSPGGAMIARNGGGGNTYGGLLSAGSFDVTSTGSDKCPNSLGLIVQQSCQGVQENTTNGTGGISIFQAATGQTQEVEANFGTFSHWAPTNILGGFSQRTQIANATCNLTVSAGNGAGILTAIPASGSCTWTLPTIINTAVNNNNLGLQFDITNSGAVNLTLATDGTQTFNGLTGITTQTLIPGQNINCYAGQSNSLGTVFQWNCSTVNATLSGVSSSIGGGALLAGACASTTVNITGATTAMAVEATPVADPGAGNYWQAFVSSTGVVTARVCAAVAGTPTATTYNIRVIP
jgi:hypothetical protein